MTMKREQLMDLVARMRYQYPIGVGATTMGVCIRCEEAPARGGSVCPYCLQDELTALAAEIMDYSKAKRLAEWVHASIADQSRAVNYLLDYCDDA